MKHVGLVSDTKGIKPQNQKNLHVLHVFSLNLVFVRVWSEKGIKIYE